MKKKNVAIDYITIENTCEAIGIKKSSRIQLTRWIQQGRIYGVFKFGKTWAIPVNWVKSECNSRGIYYNGVELQDSEKGVSLRDYEPLIEYSNRLNLSYGKIHFQLRSGIFEGDFVRFGTSYGIRKEK